VAVAVGVGVGVGVSVGVGVGDAVLVGFPALPKPAPTPRVGALSLLGPESDGVRLGLAAVVGGSARWVVAAELAGATLAAFIGWPDSITAATVPPIAATATLTPAASSADRRRPRA
jgi:hypothetical protein